MAAGVSWAVGLLALAAVLPVGGYLWVRGRRSGASRDPAAWTWS